MTGTGIQHTVIVKFVFCSLNDLTSSHLISVFVKEIGCTVNGLPAGISVLPCCFAALSVKLLNIIIIIICILGFPEITVAVLDIQLITAVVLQICLGIRSGTVCRCWRGTRCNRRRC